MKVLRTLGILAGILAMSGLMAFAGSVLSHWNDPVHAAKPAATQPAAQQAESSLQKAAVATAQEATDLPQ